MENKKKENNIQKDFYQLVNFRFSVVTLIIILTIVIAILWVITINKEKKAKPILPPGWGPNPGSDNKAPLLTIGEFDDSQANNGYAFSGLNQPCRDDAVKGGVPNLPGAFVPQPCDSSRNLVCTPGVFKGNVCLSDIGGYCLTLNDCVPGADECNSNVCTQRGDTINQKCLTSNDCRSVIQKYSDLQKTAQYNHVCQIIQNQDYGYCKVNRYPFDSGCRSDSECVQGSFCSNNIGSFNITINSGLSFYFTDTGICWGDINGLAAILNQSNKATYQIINWNGVSGNLTPIANNITPVTAGDNKITLGANNLGICLEKIPAGGPANLNIGNIDIPCQDGLTNVENFCLSTADPGLGNVCVDPEVKCKNFVTPPDSKGNTVTVDLSCLYDFNTEQGLVNDYYYGLIPKDFSVYKVGRCAEAIQEKEELCNGVIAGCKPPFVCISENDQNGNITNICNTPFEAQICVNSQCPEGYKCANPSGSPPLCKGETNTFCLENNDCISANGCGKTYNINTFGPSTGSVNNRLALPSNFNIDQEDTRLVLSYNIDDNLNPTTQLAWYQDKNNDYLYHIYIKNDSQNINKIITVTLPSDKNYQLKQIVVDEDDNIMFLHKHDVKDTMRLRCFEVMQNPVDDVIKIDTISGVADGLSVFIDSSTNIGNLNRDEIYSISYFNRGLDLGQGFVTLNDSNGNIVAPGNILGSKLCTYDNRYGYLGGGPLNQGTSAYIPFNLEAVFSGDNKNLQFYTGDNITYKTSESTGAAISSLLPPLASSGNSDIRFNNYNLVNNTVYYPTVLGNKIYGTIGEFNPDTLLFTNGVSRGTEYTYSLSDDYYSATGGYPTLEGIKIFQYGISFNNNNDHFILNNNGFFTYGITAFSLAQVKNSNNFTISNNNYINTSSETTINGINQGITYVYNSTDELEFASKKINNENYLVINKSVEYDNGSTQYVNQIMQYKYNIVYRDALQGDVWTYDTTNNLNKNYISNNGVSGCIFQFTLDKTSVINENKGFYHRNTISENIINNISLNDNNSYFYTLEHSQDLSNKSENTLAINSKVELYQYDNNSKGEPEVSYTDYANFENLSPLVFSKIVYITERQNNENYFTGSGNLLYIYNQDDINNILNFSSSELVLKKSGPYGELTWAITEIMEYDVTLETEYMIIKTQVPLVNSNIKDILSYNSDWLLYTYNFVPLEYQLVFPPSLLPVIKVFTIVIKDASLFFTATKNDAFFTNNSNFSFSRTGYHNLLLKNIVPGNGFSENTSTYSIYNMNDGAGIKLVEPSSGTSFYADPESYQTQGTSFYNLSTILDFYDYNLTNPDVALFTTLPTKLAYQNGWANLNLFYGNKNTAVDLTPSSIVSQNLNPFNMLETNQFLYLQPFPVSSLEGVLDRNNDGNGGKLLNWLPPPNAQMASGENHYYNYTGEEYTQFTLDSKNIATTDQLTQIYSGTMKLPYANYTESLYTVNDLFMSSLPLGDNFFINSNPVFHDNIVVTVVNGNVVKNLGNISLYQNAMAHYQTDIPADKTPAFFNESNQVAISWPTWLKTRYNNEKNEIPKIRKVIVDHAKGNIYGQTNYYAFVEFDNTVSLVYLNNENSNFNLAQNQGVATTVSIYNNKISTDILQNNFVMSSPSRDLYILGNGCKP